MITGLEKFFNRTVTKFFLAFLIILSVLPLPSVRASRELKTARPAVGPHMPWVHGANGTRERMRCSRTAGPGSLARACGRNDFCGVVTVP
jgi:hypothetical protein